MFERSSKTEQKNYKKVAYGKNNIKSILLANARISQQKCHFCYFSTKSCLAQLTDFLLKVIDEGKFTEKLDHKKLDHKKNLRS